MRRLFLGDLSFDRKIVSIVVISTLLLILDRYHKLTYWKELDRTILYLVIPLVLIMVVYRESPRSYGFQLGDWRAGLVITGLCLVIILPVLWFLMLQDQTMREYYQPFDRSLLPLYIFFDLIGWEFLFRGWLTFSYVRKFGPEGLWLQAVPFAIAHISKPEIETISTVFSGFIFGLIAWRTKSFIYPFIIHWVIFTYVVWLSVYNPG